MRACVVEVSHNLTILDLTKSKRDDETTMKSFVTLCLLGLGTTNAFQSASGFLCGARSPSFCLSRLQLQEVRSDLVLLRPVRVVWYNSSNSTASSHYQQFASSEDHGLQGLSDDKVESRRGVLSSFLSAGALSLATAQAANADGSRTIGEISGSGLVFKDTLKVESFDDPKVKGVTLYVSNFERPLTERIQKDFFTEPSYASVTAIKTGPITVADNIDKSTKGEPVFEEKRSLLFKELRVQRIYDEEKKTVVYVSFNTRLDKGADSNKSRFKSSISAVSLE